MFFGLHETEKGPYIKSNCTATVTIKDETGNILYNKDITVKESDFAEFTNSYWDSSRLLCCLYIKDSELKKGALKKELYH